jgi:hypothetical protein
MRDPELVARAQRAATRLESGVCRHPPDQIRDMTTDLAGWTGWNPGELPGQATDQLAARPPGPQADQPPASAHFAVATAAPSIISSCGRFTAVS